MCLCYLVSAKNCMTTSESKDWFFNKTNRFESIRITNRIESIRIANWNALFLSPEPGLRKFVILYNHASIIVSGLELDRPSWTVVVGVVVECIYSFLQPLSGNVNRCSPPSSCGQLWVDVSFIWRLPQKHMSVAARPHFFRQDAHTTRQWPCSIRKRFRGASSVYVNRIHLAV